MNVTYRSLVDRFRASSDLEEKLVTRPPPGCAASGMRSVLTWCPDGVTWSRNTGEGTPKPIIDLLNRHIVSIIQSDEYRTFMEKTGNVPIATTPEEFGRVLNQTVRDAAPYIDEFKMQIE